MITNLTSIASHNQRNLILITSKRLNGGKHFGESRFLLSYDSLRVFSNVGSGYKLILNRIPHQSVRLHSSWKKTGNGARQRSKVFLDCFQTMLNPRFRISSFRYLAIKIDVGYGVVSSSPGSRKRYSYSEIESSIEANVDTVMSEKRDSNTIQKSVSPMQRRKADDELQRYQKITSRIIASQTVPDSPAALIALLNEVRVTLHYWTTRWHFFFHPSRAIAPTPILQSVSVNTSWSSVDRKKSEQFYSDYGVNQATRLLDWIITIDQIYPQHKIVDKIISIDKNAVFVNLIDSCLLSCQTSDHQQHHQSTQLYHHDKVSNLLKQEDDKYIENPSSISTVKNIQPKRNVKGVDSSSDVHMLATKSIKNIHLKSWIHALLLSGKILDKMKFLHSSPNNELQMDTDAMNTILNILSKQCVVMLKILNSKDVNDTINTKIVWKEYLLSSATEIHNDNDVPPSNFSFLCIHDLISHMESLLTLMENTETITPDEFSYNTIIATLARLNNVPWARERADWYLKRMERTEDEDLGRSFESINPNYPRTTIYADTITYNSVIHAFASARSPFKNRQDTRECSKYAASILKQMEQRFEYTKRENVSPNTISYGTVIHGMANAGNALEAERILESMIRCRNTRVEPSLICFNSCITAWGKSGHPKASEFAESLLKRLEEISISLNRKDLQPDIISYSGVISALAKSRKVDSAHRAESILRRVIHLYQGGDKRLRPDLITFNSVLGAWATLHKSSVEGNTRIKNGPNEALQRAESLFDEMQKMTYLSPCIISHNIMLDMYARIPDLNKTESLFRTILERKRNLPDLFRGPDIISYNSLLVAMVHDMNSTSVKRAIDLVLAMDGGDIITDISHLLSSIKPDILSFNIVLGGLASRNANEAEDFLRSMEKRYLEGNSMVRPNRVSYNICIDAYAQLGSLDKAESLLHEMSIISKERNEPELMPDAFSITSVISAMTKSKEMDAPNRAEKLLRDMGTTDSCGELAPNRVTFNSVLNSWAKAGSPDRAEEILFRMEELSKQGTPDIAPDAISFTTVINAYAQKGQAQQAEKIFAMMQNRVDAGDSSVIPNAITYASVINAWAKSFEQDAPNRALSILEKMEQASIIPNEQCYNAVINTFAKCNDPQKARKCLDIVRRMENPPHGLPVVKPSIITLSTVMNACAHTKGTPEECAEAFRIARSCMKEVLSKKYGPPNNIIFGTYLFACTKLVNPGIERDRLIVPVFEECCKLGLVDEKTYQNVKRALSRDNWERLIYDQNITKDSKYHEIPMEWRKNISSRA